MTALRPPTLAELAAMIREEPDDRRRDQLLDWYWAKAVDAHGPLLAHWYREEYDRLVADRRRRIERVRSRPALGAYRRRRSFPDAA